MMGLISSRRSAGAEEPEVSTGNPYRYPPRSGEFILWSRIYVIFTDTKQWQESFQCGQSQWTRHMHSLVSENHHEFTAATTVSATNSLRPNWYAEREVKPSVLWRCWLGGRKGIRPVKDSDEMSGDTFTLEVPVVIRLTCDCAVADDAVMPIRAESSSWMSWWGSGVN